MNTSYRFIVVLTALVLLVGGVANAQIKSAKSGNWGDASTWVGGVVPGPSDNVVVDTPYTVKINVANAECNNLTAVGYLFFNDSANANGLTVNGNLVVETTGRFRSGTSTATSPRVQFITIKGNFTALGSASVDMRTGSNPNVSVGRITFAGSTDSEVSMPSKTYSSSNGEFNSVIINKTGGAKVKVVNGYVFQNNNTSQSADTLLLISGIIETADTTAWVHLATSNAAVQGSSSSSYVLGNLGRGISNGGTPPLLRTFEVGDANGLRKLTVRTQAAGGSTGHYVMVRAIPGNANTGSSTFAGSIDKVSTGRYYKVTYFPSAIPTMPIDQLIPEYEAEDGVGSGNWDLRVAYSTNNRALWTGIGQSVNDTTFTPDKALTPDTLLSAAYINLTSSNAAYVALARATGTTTNTLVVTTSVEQTDAVPTEWSLQQNYPNPFNPSTKISYGVPANGYVSLAIFNLLGQRVATLFEGMKAAGTHTAVWNGRDASGRVVPSGVYIYRMEGGGVSQARRMILMK